MFSSPASVVGEPSGYDFEKEENAAKWKGVFVNSLRKVRFFSQRSILPFFVLDRFFFFVVFDFISFLTVFFRFDAGLVVGFVF